MLTGSLVALEEKWKHVVKVPKITVSNCHRVNSLAVN